MATSTAAGHSVQLRRLPAQSPAVSLQQGRQKFMGKAGRESQDSECDVCRRYNYVDVQILQYLPCHRRDQTSRFSPVANLRHVLVTRLTTVYKHPYHKCRCPWCNPHSVHGKDRVWPNGRDSGLRQPQACALHLSVERLSGGSLGQPTLHAALLDSGLDIGRQVEAPITFHSAVGNYPLTRSGTRWGPLPGGFLSPTSPA